MQSSLSNGKRVSVHASATRVFTAPPAGRIRQPRIQRLRRGVL